MFWYITYHGNIELKQIPFSIVHNQLKYALLVIFMMIKVNSATILFCYTNHA